MVEMLYESLKKGESLREDLIALKQELKDPSACQILTEAMQGDSSLLTGLLKHPEPKVRRNAALVLGKLKEDKTLEELYRAYQEETQLFIKSDFLKALLELDYTPYLSQMEERLKVLEIYEAEESEQKHIRNERAMLQKLVLAKQVHKKHSFSGYQESYEVILKTGKTNQETTRSQISKGRTKLLKNGIQVITKDIGELLTIFTYHELLFMLNVKKLDADPQKMAEAFSQSNLMDFLCKAHGESGEFRFRLGIQSSMPLDKRSEFAKKCAASLETAVNYKLRNTTSDYELEIRLIENRDGTFLPLIKLFTIKDERFAYRENFVAASLRPEKAAVIANLAKPFLSEEAQILDPFCGVGTLLIERDRVCKARVMYGIDLYADAISGARKNAELAGKKIYYINRDFFQFTHEYLFDEIITNMPDRGHKTKEEHAVFYEKFFMKAEEILKNKGIILMYSNEKNFVKKQLRVRKAFAMLQEHSMDGKDLYYLFIIEKRG